MTKEQLAALLNGREYGDEISKQEALDAYDAGLVVVYGYSDDNIEFSGAINDEQGACHDSLHYLDRDGLLRSECDDGCPYFELLKKKAATIKALWGQEGYSWTYETTIPHATFEVFEDGEKFCRGIVFALEDAGGAV